MGKIRKISSSITEISVAETEISVTGPARLLIWTHRNFCKEKSGEARSHVVVGMTRLIKMPSYWFGDVLAVVFHIQKMFAETISQPSSCFADVKLVTGGAPYAIDDIAGSAVEMIGDLGGVPWAGN